LIGGDLIDGDKVKKKNFRFGACAVAVALATIRFGIAQQEVLTSWNPLSDAHRAVSLSPAARYAYSLAIQKTAAMATDPAVIALARARGLDVLNLTWEDTGRFKESAVGPNISDMTIQVGFGQKDATVEPRAMPVIRYPNFSDKTCDIDPSDFTLLVGNEHGKGLKRVSLREFLEDPTSFLTNPGSWLGNHHSLIADRDSKVLVSAQACFLPIPKEGLATFNPVLFNYQSMSGNPAVLTVLATREGTSTTVIDNKRDSLSEGSSWGQRLFHNQNGQRTSLTGQRLSEFVPTEGEVSKGPGMNMVLLIQIPLKHRTFDTFNFVGATMTGGSGLVSGGRALRSEGKSDVESAAIGHGEDEGQFTEIDDLAIQRDPNYPVRVTVQFYKATSNGVVSNSDMGAIKNDIDSIYRHSDSVGSLVVDGETGRPTEYVGLKVQPAGWWDEFWTRYEANTGLSRAEAIRRLRHLLGPDYMLRPVTELYLRDELRVRG
jgi:hypothetical protein